MKQFIAYIFKGGRGHGILRVSATSKRGAITQADTAARRKGCRCVEAVSFAAYERETRQFAMDDWIAKHTRI